MAEKDDKDLTFDEFKDRVYRKIGFLEALDEDYYDKKFKDEKMGCSGIFFVPFSRFITSANKKVRRELKLEELAAKAEALLAEKDIKDLLCANLDATVNQPVEAAYKLTPVLYDLAKKDEPRVPLDSYLFAIIARQIAARGVENYCPPKPKKGKKATESKPVGD